MDTNTITDQQALDFVSNYTGNFSFLVSLKAALLRYRRLSTAQLSGAKKCMIREQEYQAKKNQAFDASKATIAQGVTFSVGRFFGTELAEKVGLPHQHRQFEVLNVLGETARGYKLEIKAVGRRTSTCCVCGRTLTDSYSVQHGIGPVCAKRYGIVNVEQLDTVLTEQAKPTETWLPKTALKNRSDIEAPHQDVEDIDEDSFNDMVQNA